MNAIPAVVRELRAESRNAATFSTRFWAATVLVGLLAFFVFATSSGAVDNGAVVFLVLHGVLNLAIWVLVPLMTSDCISRERRENTLGLLFLTPLGPLDIVVAKSFVHALRALLLWLVVLPVVTVPLLMGGVSGAMVVCSVLLNATALCWALTAGLVASGFCRQRMQSVGVAMALALISFCGVMAVAELSLCVTVGGGWGGIWDVSIARGMELNFTLESSSLKYRYGMWTAPGVRPAGAAQAVDRALMETCARPLPLAAVSLVGAVLLAGRAIRLNWQEKPPGPRYVWFLRVFCQPVFWKSLFERWIRRKLERNPVGWLEQRTWVGRAAVAAWVAVVVSVYIAVLSDLGVYRRLMTELQFLAGFGLSFAMAVVAAGSFRRERELGVMELLLISPLNERQIALGRLKGIWEQFAPAAGLLLGVWLWLSFAVTDVGEWRLVLCFAATFVSVPIVGLCHSLRKRSLLTALGWTMGVGLVVPLLIGFWLRSRMRWFQGGASFPLLDYLSVLLGFDHPSHLARELIWALPLLWQTGCIIYYWRRLHRTLLQRQFPMEVQ